MNRPQKNVLGAYDGQPDTANAPLECLILDLGNVLVFHDNEKLFRELATLFEVSASHLKSHFDSNFWRRVNTGELPGDTLRQAMCLTLQKEVSRNDFFAAWNCHFTLNEPMVKRVESLVTKVRLGLLSNTHDWHFEFLRPLISVLNQFDFQVLSYEAKAMKPDEAIYQQVLSLAGCEAKHCAFFDDVEAYALAASHMNIRGRVFSDVSNFNIQLKAMGCSK